MQYTVHFIQYDDIPRIKLKQMSSVFIITLEYFPSITVMSTHTLEFNVPIKIVKFG